MGRRGLRALIIGGSAHDAELLLEHLTWAWDVSHRRVATEPELREALLAEAWDVVLCDCELQGLGPLRAMSVLRSLELDLPFIMLSGAIAEEHAADALKAGAHDIVIKGRWARLPSTVERELRQAESRRKRRAVEAALRESEVRFRTLVHSMTDLVFTFDSDQRCTGVFGQWPATSRGSPELYLGKRISEMQSNGPSEIHQDANARAFAGETVQYEYVGVTTGRHYQSSMAPMRGADGAVSGVLAVIRDITRLKDLESQLIATDRLAAVGMIADGLSDDLNNSLATLTLNLDLVLRELQHGGNVRERFAEVRAAAERVRLVARDLKVFSRTEDVPGQIDVEAVLDSAAHLAVSELLPRVQLHKRYAAVPAVFGSRSMLGQLLMGLLVAVARVTSVSARQPRVVELMTRLEAEHVVVEISGAEPLASPLADVGLAVCRRLAEALGGQLTIDGAACRLTMQRSSSASASSAAPAAAAAAAPQRGQVLIVDDNAALGRSLGRLVSSDHDVDFVESAREALDLIVAGRRFDAIVADLMMPIMSGMELHAEIDRISPDQARRMVFMTGGVFVPEARSFLDRVPNSRLTKPFPPEQLLECIGRCLRP